MINAISSYKPSFKAQFTGDGGRSSKGPVLDNSDEIARLLEGCCDQMDCDKIEKEMEESGKNRLKKTWTQMKRCFNHIKRIWL